VAVEAKRGCGYRKVGGLYLVGTGSGLACDRLPIPLEICRCCSQGIKQTRGWTWVDIAGLVGGDHFIAGPPPQNVQSCPDPAFCPLCHNVASMGRGGLLWIGAQFYPSIAHFDAEANRLGISRRITSVPRGFEIGKSWVLFAHAKGIIKPTGDLTAGYIPAIFRVWKPERLERIYKESDRGSEAAQADEKRGIAPVFVPDNDKDHQGTCYDKDEEETTTAPAKPAQAPMDFGQ
jgi:hypothetical protein